MTKGLDTIDIGLANLVEELAPLRQLVPPRVSEALPETGEEAGRLGEEVKPFDRVTTMALATAAAAALTVVAVLLLRRRKRPAAPDRSAPTEGPVSA